MLVRVDIIYSNGNVVHASSDDSVHCKYIYSLLNASAALNDTSDISHAAITVLLTNPASWMKIQIQRRRIPSSCASARL